MPRSYFEVPTAHVGGRNARLGHSEVALAANCNAIRAAVLAGIEARNAAGNEAVTSPVLGGAEGLVSVDLNVEGAESEAQLPVSFETEDLSVAS